MLRVDQYSYIRTAHRVYGKTIKQIVRETGHSRNTIKRILRNEYIGYKKREHQPYPALDPYIDTIDKWLIDDKQRPKKQRHTAVRVFHRLKQEFGFSGSEATVRRYVREAKLRLGLRGQQAFIPCEPPAGGEAEVDWGNCHAIIDGIMTPLKLFCMRSKYSGKHFVCCYPCERQQALFDGHIRAFEFFGGVFPVLIYDNLSTAVQRIYRGKERDLQKEYEKFTGYYNFQARFCNPGAAHEKGGVEGLVGYARRNYMVPVPQAKSIEELNEKLLSDCLAYGGHKMATREQSVNDLYEDEKSHLIALPEVSFSNIRSICATSDKYATVIIDKNHYSVPTRYARMKVKAIVHVERVDIFYNSQKISTHKRLYGNNKWELEPEHYLELIQKRPQSFETARAIVQWRKNWPQCLERLLERFCRKQGETKGIKDFVSVLMLYKDFDAGDIQTAIELSLTAEASTSATVEHILRYSSKPRQQFCCADNWQRLSPADVSVYQQIGGDV
jgi:transposase